MKARTVDIALTLTDREAWVYAQFLKRVTFSDYRQRAINEDETYTMIDAGERLRDALRKAGYAPR